MRGTVFDIKEMAIFDGPGVRQTVFLKGCPLRCNWCHNPEGLSFEPQIMVGGGCIGCGKCRVVCDLSECTMCGKCVAVCPTGARQICGRVYESTELAEIIKKDAEYYASLGGGVTFSGGEPLAQGEFLLEVLEKLDGVHTVIETSGFADSALFEKAVEKASGMIMDIKLASSELHEKYTGVENGVILKNLNLLKCGGTPFVIRVPLIPGVNDFKENYEKTAALIAGSPGLERVELLPYHKTAGSKYKAAGYKYSPVFDTDKPVKIMKEIFEKFDIRCDVL